MRTASLFQHAHVLQIPVILAVIEAVAYYEGVRNLEADVMHLHQPDGIHPTAEGPEIISGTVLRAIKPLLGAARN